MENKNCDIAADYRTISIHEFSWGLLSRNADWIMNHSKILIYYLPGDNDNLDYRSDEKLKEGYIIEAKIKAIARPKIEYITKTYFDEIYREFENINFEVLAKENTRGCDGWQLEIEMGLRGYTRGLSLWSPSEDSNKPELLKILQIIDTIKNKIEFDRWCKYNYDELEKWEKIIRDYRRIFRFNIDWNDDDW
jgi:hypothetical protein